MNEKTEPEAQHRIHSLDGIRAMAALMVMAFHFLGHHGESGRIMQMSVIGQTGVDLFFVLSGFLITRILLRSKECPHFFRTFYMRRTLRIFPLYFGFLAIYFFVLPLVFGTPVPPFSSQCWSWFYLENVPQTFPSLHSSGPGHFWSLAIEEHFYLVWPLMVFILSRRQFTILVVATLILSPILRFIFLSRGIPVFYFTLTRMDALAFGSLLSVLLAGGVKNVRIFRWLLLALVILLIPMFAALSGSRLDWLQAIKLTLIPGLYFALIGFCIADPAARPLARLFSIGWLRWLGAISYGLYVFHPTCFALVQKFAGPSSFAVDLALSFGLTILVAYTSFRFFESPILKLKSRFEYSDAKPTPPVS